MPEYGFSLTCIFPYKDKIFDSFFIQENTGQRKLVIWHIFLRFRPYTGNLSQRKATFWHILRSYQSVPWEDRRT